MRFDRFARALAALQAVDADRAHASHTLGMVLPGLLAAFRCRTVIEVGICDAFTTQVLAHSLAALWPGEAGLISVDNTERGGAQGEAVLGPISAHDLAARIILGDSRDVDWPVELRAIGRDHADLALIDGSHDYEVVRVDIDKTRRVLRPGGLMVLHDACPEYPGVQRAVEEFQAAARWREIRVPYDPESASLPFAILQRTI